MFVHGILGMERDHTDCMRLKGKVTAWTAGATMPSAMSRHRSTASPIRPAGFTLLELLAVLVILGLIGAVAAPQVFKWLDRANADAARVQIEALGGTVDLYRLEVGVYPPSLDALVSKPAGEERWNGPYLKKVAVPKDPWGNDYRYRLPGQHGPYDLYSLGADGAEGGDGSNADIASWE